MNEFVGSAEHEFPNVTSWNNSTKDAINRIKKDNHHFDLVLIDADHSRKAVSGDLSDILEHAEIILMRDSSNPSCRRGMPDILQNQGTHSYNLDFICSSIKHDGLWGGLGVAIRSSKPQLMKEFKGEISPYIYLRIHDCLSMLRKLKGVASWSASTCGRSIAKVKVKLGKLASK